MNKQILYHGTNKNFEIFNMNYATKGTKSSLGLLGFFFTPDAELASDFCKNKWCSKKSKYKKGANIKPVYLNLENPCKIEPLKIIQISNGCHGGIEKFKEDILSQGFDSIIINNHDNSLDFIKSLGEFEKEQYVAFDTIQIKSIFE